jgi:hypothetical protein
MIRLMKITIAIIIAVILPVDRPVYTFAEGTNGLRGGEIG